MQSLNVHRGKVDGLRAFMTWYIGPDSHDRGLLVLDDLSFESFPDLEKKAFIEFLNTSGRKLGKVLITTRLQPPVLAKLGIDASKMHQ